MKKERLKKERRATRTAKWFAKIRERTDKWFAEEMIRIEEECKANEWRPPVSSGPHYNSFALAWWSLGKASVDEYPNWRRERILYINKWCGITITNISHFERVAIKKFIGSLSKWDVYHTGNDTFDDSDRSIGSYI